MKKTLMKLVFELLKDSKRSDREFCKGSERVTSNCKQNAK